MKIAIIGATGFVGSNIIKFLPKEHSIIATYKNKDKINNRYLKKKNVKWKFLDIYNKKNFFKYLEYPDIVIHLAWSNLPNYHQKFHINKELPKQKKFLLNLIRNGLKNIFIAGTCFEYGNRSGKLNENFLERPNNNYALAKILLKKYLFSIKKYNFNLIWGRIFYIYGKHNSRSTLYNQILESSHKNSIKLKIYRNLIRDYLSIDQVSKIIISLSLKMKYIGVINICSGKGISLRNLVKKISILENIKPNIKYINKKTSNFESNKFWGCNKKLKIYLKNCE
jgi:dTDP-6-deoxy-L-talose 4-dehydrogenase (NAD+)